MTDTSDRYYDMLDRCFTEQLNKNTDLLTYLHESPQAFTIPAKGTQKRVLVVWLIIKSDIHVTLNLLNDMVSTVVNIIKEVNSLKELLAVDIVPGFRLKNQVVDRIIRVSIWAGHYTNWQQVKPVDMLKEKPCEGIQCGWYWDKVRIG